MARRWRSVKDWRPGGEPEHPVDLDAFLKGYLEAALWSSMGGGRPLDEYYSVDDIAPEAVAQAYREVEDFIIANIDDLVATGAPDEQNGNDFWLTRNRHGAGFWDRGYGEVGDRLTASAHPYGDVNPYIGDDGKIHFA